MLYLAMIYHEKMERSSLELGIDSFAAEDFLKKGRQDYKQQPG